MPQHNQRSPALKVSAVCRRIIQHQVINGGERPSEVVVSYDEFEAIVEVASQWATQVKLATVMGVPVKIGEPSYPWGSFPT